MDNDVVPAPIRNLVDSISWVHGLCYQYGNRLLSQNKIKNRLHNPWSPPVEEEFAAEYLDQAVASCTGTDPLGQPIGQYPGSDTFLAMIGWLIILNFLKGVKPCPSLDTD